MNAEIAAAAGQITEKLMHELGGAVGALAMAVRAQPGIDNNELTEDMEEFLSRYAAAIGQPIPNAWKVLRLR